MRCWHLTLASDGRLPLFRGEADRRAAVRRLVAVAGREAVLFCVVDDHVHVVVVCERARAGRLAQALHTSMRAAAATVVEPARRRPVDNRPHLQWLVRYVLGQPAHHDLSEHPALWSGSCFQDLVGARALPGLPPHPASRLRELLPRFRLRSAYEAVGLPAPEIVPADDELVRTAGAARLASAATAALAADPGLVGITAPVVAARRAATAVATEVGVSVDEIAWALGVTRRAVRKLAARPAPPGATQALRLRLAVEDAVASAGHGPGAGPGT